MADEHPAPPQPRSCPLVAEEDLRVVSGSPTTFILRGKNAGAGRYVGGLSCAAFTSIIALCLLFITSLLHATASTSSPACLGLSLSVESLKPAEYEFRFIIRNDSTKPVTLFNWSILDAKVSRKMTRGWSQNGGASQALGTLEDHGMFDHNQPKGPTPEATIMPGETYRRAISVPDLWGDEGTDHPGGTYRVTFELTPEPPNRRGWLLGNRPFAGSGTRCRLYAKPVLFQEASPAKRREYWKQRELK